jgi:hypothetical protein
VRRVIALLGLVAALLVAFNLGTSYGTDLGIEEAMRYKPAIVPCVPSRG